MITISFGGVRFAVPVVIVVLEESVVVSVSDRLSISVRFSIDCSGLWWASQSEPHQESKSRVKQNRLKVPPIGDASEQRKCIHGPIKAESVRAKEEPGVGGWQVEEGERSGE